VHGTFAPTTMCAAPTLRPLRYSAE
jgi:hypothetical protein